MQVREENSEQIVLTLTPWAPWIVSVLAGAVFLAFAVLAPVEMPGWARAVFGGLGIVAPIGFLSTHATVRAVFSRSSGTASITRNRPIGGTSRQVIPLERIAAVEEIVETDADHTSFHRIELILRPPGAVRDGDGGTRVALTTAPISIDQAETARRLASWLGVSAP